MAYLYTSGFCAIRCRAAAASCFSFTEFSENPRDFRLIPIVSRRLSCIRILPLYFFLHKSFQEVTESFPSFFLLYMIPATPY